MATKIPFETVEKRAEYLKNVSYVDMVRELMDRGAMSTFQSTQTIFASTLQRYDDVEASDVMVPALGKNAVVQAEVKALIRRFSQDMFDAGLLDVAFDQTWLRKGCHPGDKCLKVSMLALNPGYTESYYKEEI